MGGFIRVPRSDILPFLDSKAKFGVNWITLHWTVGRYDQLFQDDYHFQIQGDGTVFVDPRAFDDYGRFVPLAHTWHRNSYNVGVSLCAMLGARYPEQGWVPPDLYTFPHCYGEFPPTHEQMDSMCELVSALIRLYDRGFGAIMTHGDWAKMDNYWPDRWEFSCEKPLILAKVTELYEATKPHV